MNALIGLWLILIDLHFFSTTHIEHLDYYRFDHWALKVTLYPPINNYAAWTSNKSYLRLESI